MIEKITSIVKLLALSALTVVCLRVIPLERQATMFLQHADKAALETALTTMEVRKAAKEQRQALNDITQEVHTTVTNVNGTILLIQKSIDNANEVIWKQSDATAILLEESRIPVKKLGETIDAAHATLDTANRTIAGLDEQLNKEKQLQEATRQLSSAASNVAATSASTAAIAKDLQTGVHAYMNRRAPWLLRMLGFR
jgi:predicted  nucleic acid-binding Zn-ribbon protein